MKVNIKKPKISTQFKAERIYPELENLEITPTTEEQKFKSSKYGFDNVTVKAVESEEISFIPNTEEQIKEGVFGKVTVAGDNDLIPENIKAGVEIFGVNGVLEGGGEYNAIIDGSLVSSHTNTSKTSYLLNRMIKKLPEIDISGWENTTYMFYSCTSLTEIPLLDTSNVTDMQYMFYSCTSLTEIPLLDTSNVTNMGYMFYYCMSLTEIPLLDTSNVTNMGYTFQYCKKITEIPQLDTSNVTNMLQTFCDCQALTKVPQLNANKLTCVRSMFSNSNKLTDFGGLTNLGIAYTQKSNNYSNYQLDLSKTILLTHESLMNVINGLYDLNLTYDVANGGTLYRQSLVLGSTNLAKLTEEEIAIATNKGWDVT